MSMYTNPHQQEKKYQTTIPKTRDESKHRSPRACFLLSSTGLRPKEVQEPWEYLTNHGFFVEFATWDGKPAAADPTLLKDVLFGSSYKLQAKWTEFTTLDEWLHPQAWAPYSPGRAQTEFESSNSADPAIDATHDTKSITTTQRSQSEQSVRKVFSLDSYDLIFVPGGWATREHLENDTILQSILSQFCLNLPRSMGSKVLAVLGDGISPFLHVKNPLTQNPILSQLVTTGPGYDSWSGLVTGRDLGSQIPPVAKKYINRKVTVDPENWYISSPAASYNAEFCPALTALVQGAVRVSELREVEKQSKRLSTAQNLQLRNALEFDGLTWKQKERLNSEGIGKANSGFVLTQWSWGWREDYS